MGATDPSTTMLPVSLPLCRISGSSAGLFPPAGWEVVVVVDLGIHGPPTPLQWGGDMSCMSTKRSHPHGPARGWLRPTSAFLSRIPRRRCSGKASADSSLSSLPGSPQVGVEGTALPAWPLVPQGAAVR